MDVDELLVSQPDHGEQALEIADLLIRSGTIDVVAIDSVAALTPKSELEGQMGDQTVGLQARMMSQAMRKLAGNLNRANTLCVLTNQIREKVGVMFGSPETQPGGRALKFYSSQRLDIRRIETLKEGTEAVGNRVRVKVVKNKVAAPFRQAEFDIEYGTGISSEGCILDLGIEHDIVQKSGSFFSYGDERLGQGRNNAKGYLRENPDKAKEIEAKIYEAVGVDHDAPAVPLAVAEDAEAPGGGRGRGRRGEGRLSGGLQDEERALQLAYRALSARDRTVAEMRAWLDRKKVSPAAADHAIGELSAAGFLDDARFAERLAEDKRGLEPGARSGSNESCGAAASRRSWSRRSGLARARGRARSRARPARREGAPAGGRPRARPRVAVAGPQGLRARAGLRRGASTRRESRCLNDRLTYSHMGI